MKRLHQFSVAYLMLLVFWWAGAVRLVQQILYSSGSSDGLAFLSYLVLPVFIGPAIGGLFLKMRFGFYAGLVLTVAIYVLYVL